MTATLHKADSRGLTDHGWLLSRHTFSFADYHDLSRMNFGLLRVINDDIVKPSRGFAAHPHENMEIVSIPLSGTLCHQDSMGNRHMITAGEVQIMSAGSGLTHSEYNASDQEDVSFLQIWVYPEQRGITPRYGLKQFDPRGRDNRFQLLVSPDKQSSAIWINQQAWFFMADLSAGVSLDYLRHNSDNGVYIFVISGVVAVDGERLERRDGLGVTNCGVFKITALGTAEILLIEVPLER